MKDVEGQKEQNKMFQGGHTKVKGSGKTDLKRGLVTEEAIYTFKYCSYLSTRKGRREIEESHMAPLHFQRYTEKDRSLC